MEKLRKEEEEDPNTDTISFKSENRISAYY